MTPPTIATLRQPVITSARGLLVAAIVLTAGCVPKASTTGTPGEDPASRSSSLGPEHQAAIYEQVARWAYGGAGSQSRFPIGDTVYISRRTSGPDDNPFGRGAESTTLSADLQSRLSAQLKDVSSKIVWVDTAGDAPRDPDTGVPEGRGVILSFGTIEGATSGMVRVPFSAYYGNLGAFGSTYVLKKVSGTWQVISTTQDEWNS